MNIGPYRSPTSLADISAATKNTHFPRAMRSLRDLPTVSFATMPGLEGTLCVDMYGDLPLGVFTLPDATLRGDAAYIFSPEGNPIFEQNADFLRKKRFLTPRITEEHLNPRTTQEVGDLVSLTSRCNTGFFHWMMDSLPKVVIAEGCGFTGSYLIPNPRSAPWAEESLAVLGITPDRILHPSDSDLHAQRLFIPTYFSGYNAHHNSPFIKTYREAVRRGIPVEPSHPPKRILIVRKPATKVRRITNQEEIVQTAGAFGFEPLDFEDLPLREQLKRTLHAEAILGAHGSGLCHCLFMNEGSTLIELFPYGRKQSCDVYERLAAIPEHRYHALESSEDREGDIVVSTSALSSILALAFQSA